MFSFIRTVFSIYVLFIHIISLFHTFVCSTLCQCLYYYVAALPPYSSCIFIHFDFVTIFHYYFSLLRSIRFGRMACCIVVVCWRLNACHYVVVQTGEIYIPICVLLCVLVFSYISIVYRLSHYRAHISCSRTFAQRRLTDWKHTKLFGNHPKKKKNLLLCMWHTTHDDKEIEKEIKNIPFNFKLLFIGQFRLTRKKIRVEIYLKIIGKILWNYVVLIYDEKIGK